MERKQFTFYSSFFRAISRIKNKSARADAYDAICRYALTGELPDLDKLPDAAAMAFDMAKPVLDCGKRKAEGGQRGGSIAQGSAKDTASIEQASGKDSARIVQAYPKHTASKKEGEIEIEKEVEVEKEIENKSSTERVPPTLQEVTAYVASRGNKIDAARFYQFYSRSGFRTRTGPLDWQAKVAEWERTERSRPARQVTAAAYNARPPEIMTMDTFDALADKI